MHRNLHTVHWPTLKGENSMSYKTKPQKKPKTDKALWKCTWGSVRKEEIQDDLGNWKEWKANLFFEYIPIIASG